MPQAGRLAPSITLAVLAISCGGAIAPQEPSQDDDASIYPPVDSSAASDVTIDLSQLDGATLADATLADDPVTGQGGEADTDSGTPDAKPDSGSKVCVPATCASLGYNCDRVPDGCGGLQSCGTCTLPQWCGGGGWFMCGGCDSIGCQPCVDGGGACTPLTCTSLNYECGKAGDGCGGILDCGHCAAPATCGGGGVRSRCGVPDAGTEASAAGGCQPLTCADQGINCGPAGDGCGQELMCGTCVPPDTCGGGGLPWGMPGVCAQYLCVLCVPATCAQWGIDCGPAGDGCGNVIQCGTCAPPLTCGGGGFGKCG